MNKKNTSEKKSLKGFIRYTILLFILVLTLPAMASAKPVILYTDILSGPNTGGENNKGIYLNIFGKGFGTTPGLGTTTKVYINNVEVGAYKYLGASNGRGDIHQISVQPGSGVTSGAIKVVVSGEESNTDHSFTVRSGDIYFVDNVSGNQGTGEIGNISKPFRYVHQTFDRADFGPGDFIIMRGTGTNWTDSDGTTFFAEFNKSGSLSNPLHIMGYPGETVNIVIKSDNKTFDIRRSYFVLANFKIISNGGTMPNTAGTAILMYNNFETIRGSRIVNTDISGAHAAKQGAFDFIGLDNVKILGNHLHHNGDFSDTVGISHGIYPGRSSNIEIGWNEINNHRGGRCISIRGDGIPYNENFAIHDNFFHDNERVAVLIGPYTDKSFKVYNNVFYRNGLENPDPNDAFGDNALRIFGISGGNPKVEIYNNTFYDAGVNRLVSFENVGTSGYVIFKNNILYLLDGQRYYTDNGINVTGSNNIYYGSTVQSPPSWDTNPIQLDPLFENIGNSDFHLKAGSSAIDYGLDIPLVTNDSDGNSRPMDGDDNGNAKTDIGAYEYTGTYIPYYQCSDGLDNDGDGLTDYPNDPGCLSLTDNDEYNEFVDITPPSPPTALIVNIR